MKIRVKFNGIIEETTIEEFLERIKDQKFIKLDYLKKL